MPTEAQMILDIWKWVQEIRNQEDGTGLSQRTDIILDNVDKNGGPPAAPGAAPRTEPTLREWVRRLLVHHGIGTGL